MEDFPSHEAKKKKAVAVLLFSSDDHLAAVSTAALECDHVINLHLKTGTWTQSYITSITCVVCVGDFCVMQLHWIKLTDLKMGLIWELLNVCQLPIKNAELKRSAGGGDVLDHLAQTNTAAERFPAKANCVVCAAPSPSSGCHPLARLSGPSI